MNKLLIKKLKKVLESVGVCCTMLESVVVLEWLFADCRRFFFFFFKNADFYLLTYNITINEQNNIQSAIKPKS
jgi:hypothetical protein